MEHDYRSLFVALESNGMSEWAGSLRQQLNDFFSQINHGDYLRWKSALDSLPAVFPSTVCLDKPCIEIGNRNNVSQTEREFIHRQLAVLKPWRKGPFQLFGININSEWRSDLKWDRLSQHITPLENRLVLDIGCGNGYYAWRMLAAGAQHVVGIDPALLFMMQFFVFKKYLPAANVDFLPFGIQTLPDAPLYFDSVFSMGVIYHRRDPIAHLKQLKQYLNKQGELILETLVLPMDDKTVLYPENRYAKMNNVWAVPGIGALLNWVEQAGFSNARIVDVTVTSEIEQRRTEWMQYESLSDFLESADLTKTIEGYPAPTRALLLAEK